MKIRAPIATIYYSGHKRTLQFTAEKFANFTREVGQVHTCRINAEIVFASVYTVCHTLSDCFTKITGKLPSVIILTARNQIGKFFLKVFQDSKQICFTVYT